MRVSPFTAIWEFQVKTGSISAFEEIYGPDGEWTKLFRSSPDYLGTELVRDLNHSGRYLTFDRWASPEALLEFKQIHHDEYSALDARCEGLTEKETFLGDFAEVKGESLKPKG